MRRRRTKTMATVFNWNEIVKAIESKEVPSEMMKILEAIFVSKYNWANDSDELECFVPENLLAWSDGEMIEATFPWCGGDGWIISKEDYKEYM